MRIGHLLGALDVRGAVRPESQRVAHAQVVQLRQALADVQLVDRVEVGRTPRDDASPVDHPTEPVVDLRGRREELAAGPHERQLVQLRHLGDPGCPTERRQLLGGHGTDVDLDLGGAAAFLEPRQRALRTAGAGEEREHHRARERDQQGQHDHAAPAAPQIGSREHPDRAHHSLLSTAPGRVRAATRAGSAAIRFASRITATATSATPRAGTISASAIPSVDEKRCQNHRPAASPTGMPTNKATSTRVVACQATDDATCRRVKPNVLSIASSRRRAPTDVASRCASTPTPRTARSPARITGVARTRE